mgnify:CR=1
MKMRAFIFALVGGVLIASIVYVLGKSYLDTPQVYVDSRGKVVAIYSPDEHGNRVRRDGAWLAGYKARGGHYNVYPGADR